MLVPWHGVVEGVQGHPVNLLGHRHIATARNVGPEILAGFGARPTAADVTTNKLRRSAVLALSDPDSAVPSEGVVANHACSTGEI